MPTPIPVTWGSMSERNQYQAEYSRAMRHSTRYMFSIESDQHGMINYQ
jgi:hypothetical protein